VIPFNIVFLVIFTFNGTIPFNLRDLTVKIYSFTYDIISV